MDTIQENEDDSERPAKKARFFAPASPARSVISDAAFDDTDDLYESPVKVLTTPVSHGQIEERTNLRPFPSTRQIISSSIPGLGLLGMMIQHDGKSYDTTETTIHQPDDPDGDSSPGMTDFDQKDVPLTPTEVAQNETTLLPRLSKTPTEDMQIEVGSADLIGDANATTATPAIGNNDHSQPFGLEDLTYGRNIQSQIADLSTENLNSNIMENYIQAAVNGHDNEHEILALKSSVEDSSWTEGLMFASKANGSSVPFPNEDEILDPVVHAKALESTDINGPSNRRSPLVSPKSDTSAGGVELPAEEVKSVADGETSLVLEPNQSNEPAEWENDSSDADASSSSSDASNSSSSVGGDDEDYEFLDAEEQARILMRGDGGDDDDGANQSGKGSGGQLRTANEKPEEKVERPNVVVTPEMPIIELGIAENVVENYLLIKATISGETQVLESGSVLCLEDRTVIGAVAETLGRVVSPIYSVAFSSAAEVEQYGVTKGTRIYYVVDHAHYVFTQPLKMLKGSDASNQHDEEIGHEELEFSDDEAEAEYKRKLKQGRLEKKTSKIDTDQAAPCFASSTGLPPWDAQQYPTGPMNYDDDQGDDMYTPLARPSNLVEVSQSTIPPTQVQNPRGSFDGVRGGRGRGDRGRGRGDRGRGQPDRERGVQRGSKVESSNRRFENRGRGHYGNRGDRSGSSVQASQTFTNPINYPTGSDRETHHPSDHQAILPLQAFPGQTGEAYQHRHQNTVAPYQPNTQNWGHDAVAPYDPNYPQGLPSNQMPMSPGGSIPAGAFVNPAFFRNQQQSNSPAPVHYQQQPYPQPPYLQQPHSQQPYSQQFYSQQPYSQQSYQEHSYQQQAYQQNQYQQGIVPQFQQQYQHPAHQALQPTDQWNQNLYQTNPGAQFGGPGSL